MRSSMHHAAASPWRASQVRNAITQGNVRGALDLLDASEMSPWAQLYGKTGATASESPAAKEIAHYKTLSAELVSPSEISRAWGTPSPLSRTPIVGATESAHLSDSHGIFEPHHGEAGNRICCIGRGRR